MTDRLSPAAQAALLAILERHQHREGALLPILHDIQAEFGHIPPACHGTLAEALVISRAEIHGVISFYHDFTTEPSGARVVKLCRAEACQAMGGAQLVADVQARLGVDWHGTTLDGRVQLEPVYCLGLCACAPAGMVGEEIHGRLTAERFVTLAKEGL